LGGLKTRESDDFTIALLDGFATMADVLTFYSERIANESYLRTATERRSVLELARAIGYELNPGVAASTWLAFTVDDREGAPGYADIGKGVRVQSVPRPGEKPQTYETTEAIAAKKEWNALRPVRTQILPPHWGQTLLRLKGTSTGLKPGDALLIIGDERRRDRGNENWDFRRVHKVEPFPDPDPQAAYTLVTLDHGLGEAWPFTQPAKENARVFALRLRANLFGYNAPDWRVMPKDVRLRFDIRANGEDSTLPDWPSFSISGVSEAGIQTGLYGQYFKEEDFTGLKFARIDAWLNFTGQAIPPDRGISSDTLAVRWSGFVRPDDSGYYTFHANAEGDVSLTLGNECLIDPHLASPRHVHLEAGKSYAIKIEFRPKVKTEKTEKTEKTGSPFQLQWSASKDEKQILKEEIIGKENLVPFEIETLHLDGVYPEISAGSWIMLSVPGYQEVCRVKEVTEDSCSNFTLNSKSSRLVIEGENIRTKFDLQLRSASVFAHSEELTWFPSPSYEPVSGTTITLDGLVPDLPADRLILVRGAPSRVRIRRAGASRYFNLDPNRKVSLSAGQILTLLGAPSVQSGAPDDMDIIMFDEDDFTDESDLVCKLRVHSHPVSKFLWEKFNDGSTKILTEKNETREKVHSTLIKELNNILKGDSIYTPGLFAEVKLRGETIALEKTKPSGDDLIYLNRLLLEDAYPHDIVRSQMLRWESQTTNGQSGYVIATLKHLEYIASNPGAQLLVESARVKELQKTADSLTRVVLTEPLIHAYDPSTVTVLANVAPATHGETVSEILGSGDAARTHQRFLLKQKPLTYTPSVSQTGGETTLEVWVNDVKWKEVPTFYGRGPQERVYVTRLADDGTVSVIFGDGMRGTRLPTGQENVRVVYRKGLGQEGLVKDEQLSLLMASPLGVKGVKNPAASEGAADPQTMAEARRNAPLTVLTLDRVVSLQDYEDFARGFNGIAKALATWTWNVHSRGVFITVAGPDGSAVDDDSPTRKNLISALGNNEERGMSVQMKFGNPLVPVQVKTCQHSKFHLKGTVYVSPDRVPQKVLSLIQEALKSAFSFDARDFGQPVTLSEVEAVIHGVPGVEFVDIQQLDKVPGHTLNQIVTVAKPKCGAAAAGVQPAELLTIDENSLSDLEVKTHELRS
jgi:hypothetical protein